MLRRGKLAGLPWHGSCSWGRRGTGWLPAITLACMRWCARRHDPSRGVAVPGLHAAPAVQEVLAGITDLGQIRDSGSTTEGVIGTLAKGGSM